MLIHSLLSEQELIIKIINHYQAQDPWVGNDIRTLREALDQVLFMNPTDPLGELATILTT